MVFLSASKLDMFKSGGARDAVVSVCGNGCDNRGDCDNGATGP